MCICRCIAGDIPALGVQHYGAAVGGRGRGGGRGRRAGATSAGRARGAVARATPRARGPPGQAARRCRRPLGARRRRRPGPAAPSPQALPLRLPARRATLPILFAGRPRTSLPHAIRGRAYVPLSR